MDFVTEFFLSILQQNEHHLEVSYIVFKNELHKEFLNYTLKIRK